MLLKFILTLIYQICYNIITYYYEIPFYLIIRLVSFNFNQEGCGRQTVDERSVGINKNKHLTIKLF